MSKDQIQKGQVQSIWSISGTRILKYAVEMYHKGLNEHKLITASEIELVHNKADLQIQKWTEKWERVTNIDNAESKTRKAINSREQIENILRYTLSVDDRVDWDSLKKKGEFTEKPPNKSSKEKDKEYPRKPELQSPRFIPNFTFFEKLFKSKKERKNKEFEKKYLDAISEWETQKNEIDQFNKQLEIDFKNNMKKYWSDLAEWETRKTNFLQKQAKFNEKINQMKILYLGKNSDSVTEYCEMVLNNSEYPDFFLKNFELEYNSDNKVLIVEYELPGIDRFPKVKEVKYSASKKELQESYFSESQLNKMFDETMYKVALRTIHELFEADVAKAIEIISFNGWIRSINKANGKEEINCILSVQAEKNDFLYIDLSKIDPKVCFKSLKGVASSKLSSLTPIQPILQINKADKRFIEGYAVAHQLDTATNLAAMDWQDFEHLIRELFEKEFQTSGGEVKVTQASRDGGVDAVAFDPDPIRGGKIVIQAKRYTNTVGVSAVRDLYGTVVNEGATKGILVSTADFGPDAYEFAKGKPLTLLNGSNLLHLLEKHGHHAKIDLREAKKILAEKDK